MSEWISWIVAIVGLLMGGGGVLFYKLDKKHKSIENDALSSDQWQELYSQMKDERNELNEQISELRKQLTECFRKQNEYESKIRELEDKIKTLMCNRSICLRNDCNNRITN